MIGAELDGSCWLKAFELLKEIVQEERDKNPSFAPELELLDEATDYRREYETLLKMCDDLLHLFNLPEDTRADLKFRKSSALNSIGRYKEAAKYCEKWIKQEPENIVAATAGIYAYINTKDFTAAEKLVDRFIFDKSICGDDNDIMFTAASKLYEAMGKRKEKKQIDRALKDYDKYLQDYYCENPYYEYEDMEFGEDYLPFN